VKIDDENEMWVQYQGSSSMESAPYLGASAAVMVGAISNIVGICVAAKEGHRKRTSHRKNNPMVSL
jgi:hypothetical protein